MKGPRATTSWFEAAQLAAACRSAPPKGKAPLAAAKAPAPPKPPKAVPVKVHEPVGRRRRLHELPWSCFGARPRRDRRGAARPAQTKEEKAAQRAADANVYRVAAPLRPSAKPKRPRAVGGARPTG